MLSSDKETVPKEPLVEAGVLDCCCPVRLEGDLDRLSSLGEPLEGGVAPGDTLDD